MVSTNIAVLTLISSCLLGVSLGFTVVSPSRQGFRQAELAKPAWAPLKAAEIESASLDSLPVPELPEAIHAAEVVPDVTSVAEEAAPSLEQLQAAGLEPDVASIAEQASNIDLDVITLVAGQETYGLAIVAAGEAIYSFLQVPALRNLPVALPGILSAAVLAIVAGPMVTSGDLAQTGLGLEIATGVSAGLGASYIVRMIAPSESPKEIAFVGLLIALAGFFSFSQNLFVDGFLTLPSLPSIPLPSLPTIDFDITL